MKEIDDKIQEIFSDYIKHLSTLSTASIIFIIAFLNNEISDKSYSWLVVISIVCLLISTIGGVILKTVQLSIYSDYQNENEKTNDKLFRIGMIFLLLGFLIGIISFGIFGIVSII